MAAPKGKPRRVSLKRLALRWMLFLGGLGFFAGSVLLVFSYFTVQIPDPNSYVTSQATILTYDDGSEFARIGAQNRTSVPLGKIPLDLRHAVLAAENRNFYKEHAISPTGIIRALFNMARGGAVQGGSTITQQYAKTAFLTPDQTIKRKIKELIIAIKLENTMTKDEILESYLNTIYFGRGAYGVETASQIYFGKSVRDLTLRQSAVLASVLRSPGYYDPGLRDGNAERLAARYRYTIRGMVSAGWADKKLLNNLEMPAVQPRSKTGILAGPKGYLVAAVQKELNQLGFPDEKLLVGGLRVTTTLNKKAQEAAVLAVSKQAPKKAPDDLHIGLAAVRPGTGAILAMYGGPDYVERQLNNATQGITQAGSSFKPFALAAALEAGISVDTVWNGQSPQTFDDNGKPYLVANYGKKSYKNLTLLEATEKSVNTVYVPLGIAVGPEKVIDAARRAGIPEKVEMVPTPSVVLGVASPHVLDVANAYATFAAEGIYAKPFLVVEVGSRNGGLLYKANPQGQEVFSKEVMADLTYALQNVVKFGSGFAAQKLGRPAAGKTGTSQENSSAWWNGYTPQIAASVAFYRDDSTESLRGIGGMATLTGGSFPARIWTEFMKGALAGEPVLDFPEPVFIGEDALADGSIYTLIPKPPGFEDVTTPPTNPSPSAAPSSANPSTPAATPTKSGN
jgi:membrane peptidoglycan carboxypeptidase